MAALSPHALAIALAGLLTLGGCSAYDDGYGYGGVSLGYGSGYYDPWYYDRYGWYDGFYYPGRGYYVYDRHGKRHRWNNHHRRYWESRREGRRDWRNRDGDGNDRAERRREWREKREDSSGFSRGGGRQGEDRARDRQWGRQRESLSNAGRSRSQGDSARPSPRSERRTLGPARKGRGDAGAPPDAWRRKD